MALKDDLKAEVKKIFGQQWTTREREKVPESEEVQLGNHAVQLDATVLYADLSESTTLVDKHKPLFAAEVYKTFLYCAAKLIRARGGSITSYDGDRVMGVFIGKAKNTSAAKCGLQINYAVTKIVNPALASQYTRSDYKVSQVVGIDTSELHVARTGIRGSNDLVWVGRAANYAAKLSARVGLIHRRLSDTAGPSALQVHRDAGKPVTTELLILIPTPDILSALAAPSCAAYTQCALGPRPSALVLGVTCPELTQIQGLARCSTNG